jgi:hypothetical protein
MHHFDRRRFEMLTRVRDFGATYGELFPESTLAPQAFAAVTTAVGELEQRAVAETTASVAARGTRKREARRALEERLLLMARTAQVLTGVDAGFRAQFTLPRSREDHVLLTTARQFLERAEAAVSEFVAHAMTSTFIGDLQALIDGLDVALRDRGMNRDQLVAARMAIKEALANAMKAVAQLDVIVANHLASDPVVREVWKRGRRIVYPPKARKRTTPDAGGGGAGPGQMPGTTSPSQTDVAVGAAATATTHIA